MYCLFAWSVCVCGAIASTVTSSCVRESKPGKAVWVLEVHSCVLKPSCKWVQAICYMMMLSPVEIRPSLAVQALHASDCDFRQAFLVGFDRVSGLVSYCLPVAAFA